VRKNPRPFGGIQVVLIGDFFQLPPVKIELGAKYCFESPLWDKLNLATINLTKVYRQSDKNLIDALNEIRVGNISENHMDMIAKRNNIEPPIEAVRLYPKKDESDSYNYYCYSKICGEEKVYWSNDKFYKKEKVINPYFDKMTQTDMTNFEMFDESCQIVHLLKLKVGTRVMLLHNIDVPSGLVNGACGEVTSLNEKTVTVKFDNGIEKEIGKIRVNSYRKGKVIYSRTQIPLKLAYACTIHKVQGKTFDKIYVNLGNIFTAGQTYVALSRITALDGLYLRNFDINKIKAD
jgi:ATP-dependent DNA helicase PIF1